jgi:glycosyltransferase involved in cell wall biosynthesis
MKDDFTEVFLDESVRNRVRVFNKINQEEVRLIINSCIVSVCTSYEESQHLSGIECAACNIPIVARCVGVYYDNRYDSRWGRIADDLNFIENINSVIKNKHKYNPRECFIANYSIDVCKQNWIEIIKNI